MKKTNHIAKEEIINKIWDNPPGECSLNAHEIRDIMDAEMHKPLKEIDNALVDKCSQLLCSLYGCEESASVSEATIAESKRNLCSRIECRKHSLNWTVIFSRRNILRTAVVTVACTIVIMMIGILTEPGTLKMQTSDDGEDYITHGEIPTVDTIQNANADRTRVDSVNSMDSISDAFEQLGYTVDMPTWLPDDIFVSEVSVSQCDVMDDLNIVYTLNSQKALYLDISIINDFDGVTIAREQNQDGEELTLLSKKKVYTAQNMERKWVLYTSKNVTYQVTSGYYDLDTLLRLLDSIGEQ